MSSVALAILLFFPLLLPSGRFAIVRSFSP